MTSLFTDLLASVVTGVFVTGALNGVVTGLLMVLVDNGVLLRLVFPAGTPNKDDETWDTGLSGVELDLKEKDAELTEDCPLNGLSFTVESGFDELNTDWAKAGVVPVVPNIALDVDWVDWPNGDLALGVDVADKLKIPPLGQLIDGLEVIELEETVAVSVVDVDPLFGLLPFVKFARKSNDDFCALLKPLNPLKTGFCTCNAKEITITICCFKHHQQWCIF